MLKTCKAKYFKFKLNSNSQPTLDLNGIDEE